MTGGESGGTTKAKATAKTRAAVKIAVEATTIRSTNERGALREVPPVHFSQGVIRNY